MTVFSVCIPGICAGFVHKDKGVKKIHLDVAIYCTPATVLYELPRHFLCGFETFLWNGQTARPCSNRKRTDDYAKEK